MAIFTVVAVLISYGIVSAPIQTHVFAKTAKHFAPKRIAAAPQESGLKEGGVLAYSYPVLQS